MTSSNGNSFRVASPLCGEFTDHRWIPLTKASDAELWCFLWSAPWIHGWVNDAWGWWFETPSLSLWRHCNVEDIAMAFRKNDIVITTLWRRDIEMHSRITGPLWGEPMDDPHKRPLIWKCGTCMFYLCFLKYATKEFNILYIQGIVYTVRAKPSGHMTW